MLIKIHSIVDVITNSSSVTYVAANEKTIETVKELINIFLIPNMDILKKDDKITADDLFTFKLEYEDLNEDIFKLCSIIVDDEYILPKIYNFNYLHKEGYYEDRQELRTLLYNTYKEIGFPEELVEYAKMEHDGNVFLRVTPVNDCTFSKKIAKILSNLDRLFECWEGFNG